MGQPIHASRREPRRFGRVALTALVIGLGGAALATFPLDNLAFAGNGNGGGKGGGNGGGHGHDGGHGGGKGGGQGNSGGGQGNGEGRSNDGPGNSANAGKADPDAAQSSDDDAATDDSTTDDGSMAPSKLGKLNGFFHASPNGLANASPNSSIGRISHTFKEALSDFAAASQTPADPNATPPSGPSVDDLGAILAGATNKQVTAAQVQAIVDRLAEQNPDDGSLSDFAGSLDDQTAQDIADAANAAKSDNGGAVPAPAAPDAALMDDCPAPRP